MSQPLPAEAPWTPAIPFTPSHVSVNRVRVVDLPGVPMDDEVRGQLACHLISAPAITRYARERATELRLPQSFLDDSPETRASLPRYVDACLDSPEAHQRRAAEAIAERLGRNLGHVLLALHRGDAVNRAARADWTAADWEGWAEIRRVWLAGGLVSGRLGREIVAQARDWLAQTGGASAPHLMLNPWRQEAAVCGAARYLPPHAGDALCFDFGQTTVKRARFNVQGPTLRLVERYSPADVAGSWQVNPPADRRETGQGVRRLMTRVIAETWQGAQDSGARLTPHVMVSIAAYVQDGRLLGNGLYATLHSLAEDVRPLLAADLTELTGAPIALHFIHDGTAAAALHAGEPHTAVIVVGTALGIGCPPGTDAGLLSLMR